MAKFNLAEAMDLRPVSKLDTKAQMIELQLIDPHPDNFFTVEEDITDLAESISLNGLLQPLVVTPTENGRYRLIAGHRRRKALLKLSETEFIKYKLVSCIIQPPMSPELEMLALIQTNTDAREIGWIEKTKAAAKVEEILTKLYKEGKIELPGKMRTHVAKLIKTSEAQLARARFIDKNLIKKLRNKGLSDNTCYKLAHLAPEQQKELYKHYDGRFWRLDGTAVKSYLDNVASGRDPFYVSVSPVSSSARTCYFQKPKKGRYVPCDHVERIKSHEEMAASLPKDDFGSVCNGSCCNYCKLRYECADICPHIADDVKKEKKRDSYVFNQRLRAARVAAGITVLQEIKRRRCTTEDVLLSETSAVLCATDLSDRCRAYGCTPNQILGFEDLPAGGDDP